jgi:hypothetical protein
MGKINVILLAGDYDWADRKAVNMIDQRVLYAKPEGAGDPKWLTIPYMLLIQEGKDYHTFIEKKSKDIRKKHGPTVILTPGPQTYTVQTINIKQLNRLSQMIQTGIKIR